ncbi:MAG TPA: Lrp/AsnC family transcriptional regulator [Thermoplasmatales archaeon]|nr:Lrp/AsnC family transcriptional regulator [Thermoplasmatales archaeon]
MRIRIRKKYLFYALVMGSAVLGAVTASLDSIISQDHIPNSWVFGSAAMLVGIVVTFAIALLLSLPLGAKNLGSRIDPSFRRLRLPRREEVPYHLLAGIGNAVTTLGYFYVVSVFVDPSSVLPFFQVVILYLLVVESLSEKDAPTLAEVESSIVVTFGAILASISLTGSFNVEVLLVIFVVMNPGWVLLAIYQRKLKLMRIDGGYNDAINIRVWNVVFTALFLVLAVFVYNPRYFSDSLQASVEVFWWLALTMAVTFFAYILYIRGLGIGKASITQAVKASTILFGIPLSLALADYLDYSFSATPTLLAIKLMGIVLVVLGVSSFALTEVKAYVFINAKGGYAMRDLMQQVWRIRGVTSVSVLAGKYDMMAKIRIRTLGKGYEKVIRKLEDIEGISEFNWQSILKEWEDI